MDTQELGYLKDLTDSQFKCVYCTVNTEELGYLKDIKDSQFKCVYCTVDTQELGYLKHIKDIQFKCVYFLKPLNWGMELTTRLVGVAEGELDDLGT